MNSLLLSLLLLSVSLVLVHGDSISCTHYSSSGAYYDLTEASKMPDLEYIDIGNREDYYIAVCKDSSHCRGPACMIDERTGAETSLGSLSYSYWSEEFTSPNDGISLVYSHGPMCYDGTERSMTIIFVCSRDHEYWLVDFISGCRSVATVYTYFACPVDEVSSDPEPSGGSENLWWAWLIIALGSAGIICVLIAIFAVLSFLAVRLLKRYKRRKAEEANYDPVALEQEHSDSKGIPDDANSLVIGQDPSIRSSGLPTYTSPTYAALDEVEIRPPTYF